MNEITMTEEHDLAAVSDDAHGRGAWAVDLGS